MKAYFTPGAKKKYKFRIPIETEEIIPDVDLEVGYYRPGSGSVNAFNDESHKRKTLVKYFEIEIIGEGSDGNIKLSE